MEGNLRFKIDWASPIVGRRFTVFALFYLVFEGNFQVQAPGRAYIWRGDLTEGFLRYEFGGLIFGGAYTWRGLFSEFYGILHLLGLRKSFVTSMPLLYSSSLYRSSTQGATCCFARPPYLKFLIIL